MIDVKLNDAEKRMLQGEDGLVPQLTMQWLVEMCQVAGTDTIIDLDGTGDFHTPWTTMTFHHEISLDELKKLTAAGGVFKIPTFSNKSPFTEMSPIHGWEGCDMCSRSHGNGRFDDCDFHEKSMHEEFYVEFRKMGMLQTHSCASYLTASYLPTIGQHCSWNESSAIPYCNAVLGARSNIDGSFATCFLGKAPYYDMHVTENRLATVLVETERLIHTDTEWDLLGFAIGEDCGLAVPAITGTAKPTTTQFCKMNAGMNTGGSIRMYHIPGSTPEAPTLDAAFGGKKPQRTALIGENVLRATYEKLNFHTSDDVDMVYLGCPHLNAVDMMLLARKLEGKKVKIPLWIMTAPWLYNVAKEQGYLKIFEDAGAKLMDGTCMAAMGGVPDYVHNIAVDSAKQSYYITGCYPDDDNRLQVCYGTQDDCVDAALSGKWRGEFKSVGGAF
ncbi:MAG: aconitase X catalytic domain-containing protein [Oscillospiraceae bacterium]|jgi:predicted aconitase|nr:aconitase X catalytic domain-containing protein [Oscillospiraceae bacterium]